MKYLCIVFYLSCLIHPAEAVTTRMFRVLDICARYRLAEINPDDAIEKLNLKFSDSSTKDPKDLIREYCSVFTPNEKIEF